MINLGSRKVVILIIRKKIILIPNHPAVEPLIKINRCCRQYSARLTRLLDRFAHFDIAIQHIAGSYLKCTDFLSRNPVENATTEDVYDEQYVFNILSAQVNLNIKYGPICQPITNCIGEKQNKLSKNRQPIKTQ